MQPVIPGPFQSLDAVLALAAARDADMELFKSQKRSRRQRIFTRVGMAVFKLVVRAEFDSESLSEERVCRRKPWWKGAWKPMLVGCVGTFAIVFTTAYLLVGR